jgi:uncharacterized protein (TIGR00255 family)|tara:strand:- start:1794 stop:2675 length:882 start_codon:yes stop_codon:yes gene_type:complete
MTQSMTGYGKCELNLANANFTIELRALNSKQIDISVKMSSIYRDKELEIRKQLSAKLFRGKVELSIWREKSESSSNYSLNIEVLKNYNNQILELRQELPAFKSEEIADLMPTLLKMPDAIIKGEEKVDQNEWEEINKGISIALNNLIEYRSAEGLNLKADILFRINKITDLLIKLTPFVNERIEKIKTSLFDKISELEIKNIDENRFEQELIYYLEKQDITEEQVRLKTHLEYFKETIENDFPNGKKLGFISQEIGREVNTIGSKSSNADMQKIVVQMKDELEKIKEQLLNIL